LPDAPFDLGRFAFALIGVAIVALAAIVNRFAPQKRHRVRRVVILYVLYLLAFGAQNGLAAIGAHAWAGRVVHVAAILEAFSLINIVALTVFDLTLPALRVAVVSITSDLLVGLAYIVATLGVLHGAGMDPSSVLATSALVGGIITFSLQSTLGNVIGGVALQLDGSIHVGDWLQLENGRQGVVKEIRWRHTVLETRDWDTIIVPNASLLATNIMILGKREGETVIRRRMWVHFNVDFRFSPTRVVDVVEAALLSAPIDGVASDPPPHVVCYDLARDLKDGAAYYAARYWLTDLPRDDAAQTRVRARVFTALRRANIPLALPAQKLYMKAAASSSARDAKTRNKRHDAIGKLDLFQALTHDELVEVEACLRYAPFARGETIVQQGSMGASLFILAHGTVDVVVRAKGASPVTIATIDAPGFFGEMGLMTGEPRAADVVARVDVECYRLDKDDFERIVVDRPEMAEQISATLARRRVELEAAREGLDAETKRMREANEQRRILRNIQEFFALSEPRKK
jgi:small-conductance mechanosensitive channel/CRP-like cAMP-binding protein